MAKGTGPSQGSKETLLITCRLIDFTEARIDEVSIDFHPYLVVTGIKPYANMEVRLIPRCYIQRPDYWAIEVVGCISRIALPATVPFEVVLPLDWEGGRKGIRVVGANQSQTIDHSYKAASNPDDGGKQIILAPRKALPRTGHTKKK